MFELLKLRKRHGRPVIKDIRRAVVKPPFRGFPLLREGDVPRRLPGLSAGLSDGRAVRSGLFGSTWGPASSAAIARAPVRPEWCASLQPTVWEPRGAKP